MKAGDRVKVVRVPPHYEWLKAYVGREGYIINDPVGGGFKVEFDDGDVEAFKESELSVVAEA